MFYNEQRRGIILEVGGLTDRRGGIASGIAIGLYFKKPGCLINLTGFIFTGLAIGSRLVSTTELNHTVY